jgi:hypothetical protein
VTQKPMPNQHEQYGDTVHLFIGMGRSPRKITLMPFTFINDSMIILRGLIWFFIFKSVSFFRRYSEALLHTASALRQPLRSFVLLRIVALIRVRRYLFTYYTPETLLNHVFEDLRKPKAPNRLRRQQHPRRFSRPTADVLVLKAITFCSQANTITFPYKRDPGSILVGMNYLHTRGAAR